MGTGTVRAARLALVLAIVLAAAGATSARAADALSPRDLAWLSDNLNLAADSPVLLTMSEALQARLHALIGRARTGADRKRQDVVNFITGTVGDSFEATLGGAQQAPAPPTELGSNRKP